MRPGPCRWCKLVDAATTWANPVSRDFERFHLPVERVIDLVDFDESKVAACAREAMDDLATAREKYNQPFPLRFKTTAILSIICCVILSLAPYATHIRVNGEVYGNKPAFYAEVVMVFSCSRSGWCATVLKKEVTLLYEIVVIPGCCAKTTWTV